MEMSRNTLICKSRKPLKELEKLASLTDPAPVDKVNFFRAYAKAHSVAFTERNIASGWRVTGNWPISLANALRHAEICPDKEEVDDVQGSKPPVRALQEGDTPYAGRQIRDLARHKTPRTWYQYTVIAKGLEDQEMKLATHAAGIASLEEVVERLQRRKKRKAVPTSNRKFMTVAEVLGTSQVAESPILRAPGEETIIEEDSESESEALSEIKVSLVT